MCWCRGDDDDDGDECEWRLKHLRFVSIGDYENCCDDRFLFGGFD